MDGEGREVPPPQSPVGAMSPQEIRCAALDMAVKAGTEPRLTIEVYPDVVSRILGYASAFEAYITTGKLPK